MDDRADEYDIAFVEGALSTPDCIKRIHEIRRRSKVLVALGSCAVDGGVNAIKNLHPIEEVRAEVYGKDQYLFPTLPALPLSAVVKVDHNVRGCPMTQIEFLKLFTALVMGKKPIEPDHAVCVECKLNENECVYAKRHDLPGAGHARGLQQPVHQFRPVLHRAAAGLVSEPEPGGHGRDAGLARAGHGRGLEAPATLQRVPAAGGQGMSRDLDMQNLDITVKHLTRVEGHGNIVVDMKNGVLKKAQLDIVEAPRYFEALLKGRSFHEAAIITSRICGICSLGHQLTSLKATEQALGLRVTEQTVLLRKLLVHGATLQSNVLHAYFLAAPDFLKVKSVIPLVGTHPEVVLRALRMKKLANDIGDAVGGRAVHPITCVPGGFTYVPTAAVAAGAAAAAGRSDGARLAGHRRDDEGPGRGHPRLREADRVHLAAQRRRLRAVRRRHLQHRHRPRARQRVPPHDQRVRGAAQHQQALQGQPVELHGRRAGALEQQPRPAEPGGAGAWRPSSA
jgi:Ni,Fe-hydrogenase III small subunit